MSNIKSILIISYLFITLTCILTVNIPAQQFLGCYIDDIERDVNSKAAPVLNIEACQDFCKGYNFFALQAGSQCFCGNKYASKLKYTRVADTECGANKMGGGWRNSVFI